MTHYTLLVAFDYEPDDSEFDSDDLHKRMRPYEEQGLFDGREEAKWDWYVVGGRWDKSLLHKDGTRVNCLQKKDLDLETNLKNELAYIEKRYGDKEETKPEGIMEIIDGCKLPTKTERLEKAHALGGIYVPCAFLDLDNKWHEAGRMLYFGVQDSSCDEKESWDMQFKKLFDELDPETWLLLVDVHI